MKKKTAKKAGKAKPEQKQKKPQVHLVTAEAAKKLLGDNEQTRLTYKLIEFQDMKAIEQEMAGAMTDKFAYQFTQKKDGKDVIIRGIRAVGIREALRFSKLKIYNFTPEFRYEREDLGDGWNREIVYCKNPKTGEVTRSSAQFKRGDRFSDRIAGTIAERNAMIKQLPAEIQYRFIKYCVERGFISTANTQEHIEETQEAMAALPEARDEEKKAEEAEKGTTALITQIYAIFGTLKIDSKAARLWMHKIYKTESLKSLTAEKLQAIIKGLKDIQYNTPEHTKKPKPGIMTRDELADRIKKAAEGARDAEDKKLYAKR